MSEVPEPRPAAGEEPGATFKSALKVKPLPDATLEATKHATLIFNQAAGAISNFDRYYVNIQRTGETTEKEFTEVDDLLRAMLLFACSGLDAVVKQLVQDALELILREDPGAQNEFRKFVERRIKRTSGDEADRLSVAGSVVDSKLLAELMVSFDPRARLVAMLTRSLTSDSLQSRDQLLKVAAHFALQAQEVMDEPNVTKEAFDARNQIVHEMDVDLGSGNARRPRDYAVMVKWCDNILNVSQRFIGAVEGKLPGGDSEGLAEPVFPIAGLEEVETLSEGTSGK